ncbi:hypothetical protein C0389_06840 [bacterium]|nr:hypothetical protein [bacterium]
MSFEGLLNKVCNIQKRTKTQDTNTGEIIESWANVYSGVACRLDESRGTEYIGQDTRLSRADHVLFLKKGYTLTTGEYRVIIDTTSYNILSIRDAGGQGHHIELELEIIK